MRRSYVKKILAAVFCITVLLCTAVSSADFKEGDIAYVKKYSLPVTEKPIAGGSKIMVNPGAKVTILEPYVKGKDKTSDDFHKIKLADGTIGYVYAYVNRLDTPEPAETAEKRIIKKPHSYKKNAKPCVYGRQVKIIKMMKGSYK